jgi:YVTN family beta-propeller protein
MISLTVLTFTSVIAFPIHAEAIDKLELDDEREEFPAISLGRVPSGIVVDDDGNVYVSHHDSNTVSVINGDTLKVSAITVGEGPTEMGVNNIENRLYVVNRDSDSVSVIEGTEDGNYRNIANVTVGDSPEDVFVDEFFGETHVPSRIDNNITAIFATDEDYDTYNYSAHQPSKIALSGNITYVAGNSEALEVNEVGADMAYVPVGLGPKDIALYSEVKGKIHDIVYVSNAYSNTVSVIEGIHHISTTTTDGNYRNIANVSVDSPRGIAVDRDDNIAYVANRGDASHLGSDTVSVIEETEDGYRNVANIAVGDKPEYVTYDENTDIAYVASGESRSVYAISGLNKKLQVGTSFEVEPFHAGQIECDGIKSPTNQYVYVDFQSSCKAQANKGFQFSSWSEDLGNNSTRTINVSTASNSPIDWLTGALGGGANDTTATLTPSKFGKFVARFEEVPPPFPSEYLIPLYGIIVSSIVGWSIPSIISWIRVRREGRASDEYHKRIQSLYNDGKLDHADIKPLNKIRNDLSNTYAKGKISEQQYQNLKGETGVLYEEIHRKRIDFLNGPLKHNSRDDRLLTTIKQDIDDDFAKGKISKEHYDLLNKKIESFVNTDENKKSKLHDADET